MSEFSRILSNFSRSERERAASKISPEGAMRDGGVGIEVDTEHLGIPLCTIQDAVILRLEFVHMLGRVAASDPEA